MIHGRETATKTMKTKLHSVTALKRYLNEKNLIHGRETATKSANIKLHLVTVLK